MTDCDSKVDVFCVKSLFVMIGHFKESGPNNNNSGGGFRGFNHNSYNNNKAKQRINFLAAFSTASEESLGMVLIQKRSG